MRGGFRPSKEADKDICPAVRQQVNVTRKRVVILLQHIISIVLVIQDGKGRESSCVHVKSQNKSWH